MSIALLTIGTELTRGELHNTNNTLLAQELSERGYEVTTMLTVDDDPGRIVASLALLSGSHRAVVCTGGLGPTTDDLTTCCVAEFLRVPLVRDEASLEQIRARFASADRTMSPSNEKQADFPQGAWVMPNPRGTAPGFSVALGSCQGFFMPGVPSEMHGMFLEHVLQRLFVAERSVVAARVQTYGLAEAEVNERLQGIELAHGVTLGYRASSTHIEVKVLTETQTGESREQAQYRAERVIDAVCERLGPVAFGRGNTDLSQEIGRALLARGLTLGVAESCTGGLVSEWLTRSAGASRYYQGGVCSYANQVKEALLHVPAETLTTHGAVSEATARAMAEGARRALGSDVGLAFTGVAGPEGGTAEKPVGLVHWAVATPQGTQAFVRVFSGSRNAIQKRAAVAGLATLLQLLRGALV